MAEELRAGDAMGGLGQSPPDAARRLPEAALHLKDEEQGVRDVAMEGIEESLVVALSPGPGSVEATARLVARGEVVPMACIFEFLTCLMADDAALPHWFPVRTSASPFAEFGGAHTVSAPVSRKPPQTRNGRNPKKTEGPP